MSNRLLPKARADKGRGPACRTHLRGGRCRAVLRQDGAASNDASALQACAVTGRSLRCIGLHGAPHAHTDCNFSKAWSQCETACHTFVQ